MFYLDLLACSRNVLISGVPSTGKPKLLAEMAPAFRFALGIVASWWCINLNSVGMIPIPPVIGVLKAALTKVDCKVFRTVLYQNSNYFDFVLDITPAVNWQAAVPGFTIVKGTLCRASEHAKGGSGAVLLIIDEINRGLAMRGRSVVPS